MLSSWTNPNRFTNEEVRVLAKSTWWGQTKLSRKGQEYDEMGQPATPTEHTLRQGYTISLVSIWIAHHWNSLTRADEHPLPALMSERPIKNETGQEGWHQIEPALQTNRSGPIFAQKGPKTQSPTTKGYPHGEAIRQPVLTLSVWKLTGRETVGDQVCDRQTWVSRSQDYHKTHKTLTTNTYIN